MPDMHDRLTKFTLAATLLLSWLSPAALAQGKADLRIVSDPNGAAILVNGESRGSAPQDLKKIPSGTTLVIVRKEGYEEARRTVSLLDGQSVVEEFKLTPIGGLLLVHSTPEGAEVSIDGAFKGRTPLFIQDLPLGDHRVALKASGFQDRETTISVKDRRPMKVAMDLTSDSGSLDVGGTPAGAAVLLDGQPAGTLPFNLERVTKGTHTVQVKMDGYEPFKSDGGHRSTGSHSRRTPCAFGADRSQDLHR
jgi:hypothetical protein